jgi:hypothetical protein
MTLAQIREQAIAEGRRRGRGRQSLRDAHHSLYSAISVPPRSFSMVR